MNLRLVFLLLLAGVLTETRDTGDRSLPIGSASVHYRTMEERANCKKATTVNILFGVIFILEVLGGVILGFYIFRMQRDILAYRTALEDANGARAGAIVSPGGGKTPKEKAKKTKVEGKKGKKPATGDKPKAGTVSGSPSSAKSSPGTKETKKSPASKSIEDSGGFLPSVTSKTNS